MAYFALVDPFLSHSFIPNRQSFMEYPQFYVALSDFFRGTQPTYTIIYHRSTSFAGISHIFQRYLVFWWPAASLQRSPPGEPQPNGARTSGHRSAVYRRPVRANGAAKSAERPGGNKGAGWGPPVMFVGL